jgi:hypothetical protein
VTYNVKDTKSIDLEVRGKIWRESQYIYIYIWKWHLTLRHLTLRKINNFLFLKLINYTWHLLSSYPINLTEKLLFRIYRHIGLKRCAFKFYRHSEEVCAFKFYRHIGLKRYYFSYKYQFVIDRNQLENNVKRYAFKFYKHSEEVCDFKF